MIKFFRNIRQKLLIEGKTGNYLKYAIGEIVLVVIGILIALQVNNWNEQIKHLNQENVYLTKLKEDVQMMKENLDEQLKLMPIQILEAQKALYYVQNCNEFSEGYEALQETLLTHGNMATFFIREGTYVEMLSNGAFSRIENDSLKTMLSNLYTRLHESNDYVSYFRTELSRASTVIWEHMEQEFKPNIELDIASQDQIVVKYNYSKICKSGSFKNALAEVYDARQDVYNMSQFISDYLNRTIELLYDITYNLKT
jgi:hypothetical protein